jgi:carbamoyl-phosphate synthase large subunit
MPARTDLNTIMIIGSGPIVIGQACEFDYSGTQAVRALEEEGYRVVLVNPNPATVMTTPGLADSIYVEPLSPEYMEAVIRREKPDAVLSTMGGQTALNLTLELQELGILEKYGVEVIGASGESIRLAEDRSAFKKVVESWVWNPRDRHHAAALPGPGRWPGRPASPCDTGPVSL